MYFATPQVMLINETSVSVSGVVGACHPSTHWIPSRLLCISSIPVATNDKNKESTLVREIDVDALSKMISFQVKAKETHYFV